MNYRCFTETQLQNFLYLACIFSSDESLLNIVVVSNRTVRKTFVPQILTNAGVWHEVGLHLNKLR